MTQPDEGPIFPIALIDDTINKVRRGEEIPLSDLPPETQQAFCAAGYLVTELPKFLDLMITLQEETEEPNESGQTN